MIAPATVSVRHCGECPFGWDGIDMGDCWRCTAVDLGDSFRELKRIHSPGRGWSKPPLWCPLRKADRLVQLRVT